MEAEVRDILRDAVKEEVFAGGLGTEITSLFSKIGLAETEHIPELRGFKIRPLLFKR
jgi:plasmid stability protein